MATCALRREEFQVYWSGLSREIEPSGCVCVCVCVCLCLCIYCFSFCLSESIYHPSIYLSIYLSIKRFILKNWLTWLWTLGEFNTWWGRWSGWRLGEEVQFESKGSFPVECSLPQFLLWSPLTKCVTPTHIVEDNLLHSKSTHLNIKHMQNTPAQKYLE